VYQVWDVSYASFDTARIAGGATGQSAVFVNKVGGGSLPMEYTVLPGIFVPEPSTIALGLLGAGALLLRRRN
ncbi:MAG: PEP-CTERM sorting domain-containing protein, partial [Verrucomicrobiota bacterium]